MRAAVYYGRRDVRIESVKDPGPPRSGELLLEVIRAGICGTDVSEYLHGPQAIPVHRPDPATGYQGPVILGHEFLGRVVEVGPGVEGFQPGQRVVSGAGVWCGQCAWCRAGRTNLCERYYTLGLQADGGLAEYVRVPAKTCVHVAEECPDDAAALAQPLAVAVHAVHRAGVVAGQSVAVVGVGTIGSLIVAAAARRGARPLVAVDVKPERLRAAEALGATHCVQGSGSQAVQAVQQATGGQGADVVIESSGAAGSAELACAMVRRGGRILQVGLHHEPEPVALRDLVLREVDLITTVAHVCPVDLPEAVRLLADGALAQLVVDRVIGLPQLVPDGLMALAEGRARGKILVDPRA